MSSPKTVKVPEVPLFTISGHGSISSSLQTAAATVQEAHTYPDVAQALECQRVLIPVPRPVKPPPPSAALPTDVHLSVAEERALARLRVLSATDAWLAASPQERHDLEERWGHILGDTPLPPERRGALLVLFARGTLVPLEGT